MGNAKNTNEINPYTGKPQGYEIRFYSGAQTERGFETVDAAIAWAHDAAPGNVSVLEDDGTFGTLLVDGELWGFILLDEHDGNES